MFLRFILQTRRNFRTPVTLKVLTDSFILDYFVYKYNTDLYIV